MGKVALWGSFGVFGFFFFLFCLSFFLGGRLFFNFKYLASTQRYKCTAYGKVK